MTEGNPVKYEKGSLQKLKPGVMIKMKNGTVGKVVEFESSDGKKYNRIVFVQGLSSAEMEDLRKKRRSDAGQGKGRRQPRKEDGVEPMNLSKAKEVFNEHYDKKAKKLAGEESKELASKLKAGDISKKANSKRPLDPNKPNHLNLYASNPEKYDVEGVDTPGSVSKSPFVKEELKKIDKQRSKSLKKAREVKNE